METDSIQRQKRNNLRRKIVIGLISLVLLISLVMAIVIYITTGEEDITVRIGVADTEMELVADTEMELLDTFNKKYLKEMSILHKSEIENLERCDDENMYCASWASSGFCLSNPSYMHLHCKLSCQKCSPSADSCSDGDTNCQPWAARGECHHNPDFMKVKCKSSCGLCGDCADKLESCPQLARDGFCRSKSSTTINYKHMVTNCQKSCGFCGEVPSYLLDQHSCWRVSSVPEHVMEKYKLEEGFYAKYTEAYGFPILASKAVDNRALMRMCYLVRWVHASHKEARAAAHANYVRFVIIGKNQRTTSLPEFRWLGPSWDERARGFGGHVTAASEENLLNFDKNKWKNMDMGLHEVSHNVHLSGLEKGKPTLFKAIEKAYMSAMADGKYFLDGEPMYARGDFREYFAEGTNSLLGDTWKDRPPHNADQLELYDPTLSKMMSEVYPCNPPKSFIFLHNDIDQILSRQSRLKLNYPSCEPEPLSNIPNETEIKLKKRKKKRKREIYSWSREKCKLPSIFNGKKYTSCIITEESRRGAWCPTHTDQSGAWYDSLLPSHENTWAFCQQQNPEPRRCANTTSGKPCVFPFTYLGLKHVSCQGTGWCATKVGRRRTMLEWSTCADDCYSSQENEHKVNGLTNLS